MLFLSEKGGYEPTNSTKEASNILSTTTSIAVLPFRNISNDPENEFFCDGITEEIINAFTKIEQLKVISRTSSFYFKDQTASIQDIAAQLDVNTILEGSVRVNGNRLRIGAQLIKVEDDSHFWSQSWDRQMENLFDIQDEISLLIADKLREHLGHLDISDHLIDNQTDSLDAYNHYLKGRYHVNQWNPKDTQLAIDEFDKAVALDKTMTNAYLGLADAYSFLAVAGFAPREEAWTKAKAAMNRAQQLDPNNPGLNYMLANEAFFTNADFAASLAYALKALENGPTFPEAQRFTSFAYTLRGDFKRAKDHIFYAKSIDPLNPETLFYEAFFYYRTGSYERALSILEALLAENSQNLPALVTKIYLLIKEERFPEAQKTLEEAPETLLTPDERLGLRCLIEASADQVAPERLTNLINNAKDPKAHHAHSYLFMVYAALGQYEEAYILLEHLFTNQSSILLLGFSDPLAENIRNTGQYQAYHRRIYPKGKKLAPSKAAHPKPPDKALVQEQLDKVHTFMRTEKPFLNPALSLRLLASQLAIHPNQLSWLINEHIGKNFNEFINEQRIAHFKELVVQPSNAHISLLGLAYESGFNSKTVFNTAFRKMVGMTPSQYQKSQK